MTSKLFAIGAFVRVGPHHHDTWERFALDTKLDPGVDATRADVVKFQR